MMRMLRCFPVLIFAAHLAACDAPPEFSASLGDPGEPFDKRLEGDWVIDDLVRGTRKIGAYARITSKTQSVLVATFLMFKENEKTADPVRGLWQLEAHPTVIDGKTFYNVRRLGTYPYWDYTAPSGKRGTMILRPVFLNADGLIICGFLWPTGDNGVGKLARNLEKLGLHGRMVKHKRTGLTHSFVETDREELHTVLRRSEIAELFVPLFYFIRYGTNAPPKNTAHKEFINRKLEGRCQLRK